tara:strand:- start:3730 stop:4362 length:633 start_codon:yes stop_codon:yes gene_type:complete
MGAKDYLIPYKKMKTVCITGGIGSGKTKALSFFESKGIPCYNSDQQAKLLINTNSIIKSKIKEYFGNEIYEFDKIDSKVLSRRVFNSTDDLNKLNSIVHPFVNKNFIKFKNENESPLIFKESAILFESKANILCDYIVLITAPKINRIERVVKRDLVDSEQVEVRISRQWSDEKKSRLANKVIINIDWDKTILDLEKLLIDLKNKFNITD